MEIFISNSLYLYQKKKKRFQSPVKNTNEIKNNANTICAFKFFEVGGIIYRNQPTFCGKNGFLIRSWRFLDKNDTQLLQSLIIITQAGRDNAVASASDCRYRGQEFEPTPYHITDVKFKYKIPLTQEGQLSITGGCTGIHVLVVYMCS